MSTSKVEGPTLSVVRPGKETFTVALPSPAVSGTRTGPWNWSPQQRASRVNLPWTGGSPAFAAGKAISTTGCTVSGTCV
jgi:hypothetical protein